MANRLKFLVEIDQPERAAVTDVRAYVFDAVSTWSGSLQPPGVESGGLDEADLGDPLWGVGKTVKVKRLTENLLRKLAGPIFALDEMDRRGEVCVALVGLESDEPMENL